MSARSLALLAAVLSGVMVAVQARVNGGLAEGLDDPLLAAVISFGSGLVAVVAVVLSRPAARAAWGRVRDVPWSNRIGGLGGASLVAAGAFAAPRIGVAMLTVAIVAGQTTGGLVADQMGLAPGGPHALTLPRVGGAALCLVAVLISVLGKGAGDADPVLLLAVVVSGFLVAVQQALNGRVRIATKDAGVATLVNFIGGTSALIAAYLLVRALVGLHVDHWPHEWWLYTGGVIGASFVAMAAIVVRILGVLRLGLATIAGQLVGAIALDVVTPAAAHGVARSTLLGAALTFVAVGVSGMSVRQRVPA